MNTRKRLVRSVARWWWVRLIVLGILKIGFVLDRVWSHARFRALVHDAGEEVLCHWTVEIKVPQNVKIGSNVRINKHAIIGAGSPITIGDHVVISQGAMIETGGIDPNGTLPYPHTAKPIVIERGAWIAAGAIVLGGVTIGECAVIGAGAVISADVPPFAFVNAAANRMFIRKKPAAGTAVEMQG